MKHLGRRAGNDRRVSPLTQGRGLKHHTLHGRTNNNRVAPHAGAWIETHHLQTQVIAQRGSPLTQGRGLKLKCWYRGSHFLSSPLTQGRGLKPLSCIVDYISNWSPLTQGRGLKHGGFRNCGCMGWSPLTQGRGLKLMLPHRLSGRRQVAPHAGAWIETLPSIAWLPQATCRPSRRGVD